jgi:N-sulfoglucosamine sulfohydrolase
MKALQKLLLLGITASLCLSALVVEAKEKKNKDSVEDALPKMALREAGKALKKGSKTEQAKQDRPNILWLVCEDISPYLGCYGDKQAQTPNLDKLASEGVRFTRAYANAPVCAVARSTLLTGMYASTIGTQHMRSRPIVPDCIPVYPRLFKKAGYYCYNGQKTDYNSLNHEKDKTKFWDVNRGPQTIKKLPKDKPFFTVFNTAVTHEGQIRADREQKYVKRGDIPKFPRIPPEEINLPPYHPDLPEIRHDWARLYDQITLMDSIVGNWLNELEKEGLADNTIVFFYSDHGGMLSRSKRFIFNGGTQVPFIVRIPKKWQHLANFNSGKHLPGSANNELVQFADFAKTVCSIAGIKPPKLMQGRVFMGPNKEPSLPLIHLYRDRQNALYDFSRAVTDGRYYLIRNFMPHRIRGQQPEHGYNVHRNWNAWSDWYYGNPEAVGPLQSRFFKPKPVLEFYDLESDPWQVNNLALDPALRKPHEKLIANMEKELYKWMVKTRDTSLIPEPMWYDFIGKQKKYKTIYEYAQSKEFQVSKILEAAKSASKGDPTLLPNYLKMLVDSNPCIRHWAAYGLFLVRKNTPEIQNFLRQIIANDPHSANRTMAAQALARCGDPDTAFTAIMKEINTEKDEYKRLLAINALLYGRLDSRLTKEDWGKLAKHKPSKDYPDYLGYYSAQNIPDHILKTWPERIIVD